MTIQQALDIIEQRKPDASMYTEEAKIKALSIVDRNIKNNIIDTHEGGESIIFNGYTTSTPRTTELLVGEPYEEIYILFLEAKIDFYFADYEKYNQSAIQYDALCKEFFNEYNRTHKPLNTKIKYF